jgi:hypothetical protein
MVNVLNPDGVRTGRDISKLQGKVVLVKSSRDRRNPPAALRGWFEVHQSVGAAPEVSVAVEFPQMFTSRAHHRTYPLNAEALDRLLAAEKNGTYEFTIDEELT